MRIGWISDVHGNRHALEAVVADASEVDRWWVLGDLAEPDLLVEVEAIAVLP